MDPRTRHLELLEQVRSRYPSAVAEPTRMWQYAGDEQRLNEALFVSKALIVTLGSVSIAWCRSVFLEPPGVRRWHESLKRRNPTLGLWARAALDGAKLARMNGVELAGFSEALGSESSQLEAALTALVRWRNGYGGGGGSGLRGTATLAQVAEFEELLITALRESSFLGNMRFAFIDSSSKQRRTGQFLVRYRKVVGDNRVLEPGEPFEHPDSFYLNSLYLLLTPGQDIDLTPLWTMQPCRHCRHDELCYLVRAAPEALEYASFGTNHTVIDRRLASEIEWFDGGLAPSGRFRPAPLPATLSRSEHPGIRRSLTVGRVNLPDLYRQTQAAMVAAIRTDTRDAGGTGWGHTLGLPTASVGGTSMGLRIMHLIGADLRPYRSDDLIQTLWRLRLPGDGCWAYGSQGPVSRPEATADVLMTFHQYGRQELIEQVLPSFERILARSSDELLRRHVFSLAVTVEALASVAPGSPVLGDLVDTLWRAARIDQRNGALYWTRLTGLDPDHDKAVPSAFHTARAALALLRCFERTDGKLGRSPGDLQTAAAWLLGHSNWSNSAETICRPFGRSRSDELVVRYFTATWVVRMLLELDVDPSTKRLVSTVTKLYYGHTDGVWDWEEVRRPVWATLDALNALRSYAVRASPLAG